MTETRAWRKEMGRWINRLRFKTIWRNYIEDRMTYGDYKIRMFDLVKTIRIAMGNNAYNYAKYEEGWQYRNIAHENYKIAFDELINLIYGWW